jgi:PhoH-like ATPase
MPQRFKESVMTGSLVAGAPGETKLFVLDTNVILHDSGSVFHFDEHDVAIPITVLEELDKFKRGNEDIHFQAREFLRQIDALTGDLMLAAFSFSFRG